MRCESPEAEAIIGKEYPVLDKGFVRLIDYMGNDERIVQAARISYGQGNKTPEEDKKLINYLIKNKHTSPLEQVVLTFHIKLPIFCLRQIVRHRTARINEISGRYSILKNEFYIPDEWRTQDSINKQSSVPGEITDMPIMAEAYEENCQNQFDIYDEMLNCGVGKEMARIGLPLSLYTEMYWQMDLNNLFHFLKLRLDSHAQYETREYARAISELTKKVAPIAYEAFEKHILDSKTISSDTIKWLREYLKDKTLPKELLDIIREK